MLNRHFVFQQIKQIKLQSWKTDLSQSMKIQVTERDLQKELF